MTVSLNFWFPATPEDESVTEDANSTTNNIIDKTNLAISEPKEEGLLQLMREIENAVGESLQDAKQVY